MLFPLGISFYTFQQIAFLIDIRSNPYDRFKPDFWRRELAQHLQAAGIRYVFMGDTLGGNPTQPACFTLGKVDYVKIRAQNFYQTGIGRLQSAHQQQLPVALMEAQSDPAACHRVELVSATLTALGIELIHIDENGALTTQADALERRETFLQTQPDVTDDTAPSKSPRALLKRVFGYDHFRPLQSDIIENVLKKLNNPTP